MRLKKLKKIGKQWRFYVVTAIFLLIASFIFWRLYSLQILKHAEFSQKAAAQIRASEKIKNNLQYLRGSIFFQDKEGNLIPVAVNKTFYEVFAVPKELEDKVAVAKFFSQKYNLSYEDLMVKFSKTNSLYEPILKKIEVDDYRLIQKENFKGVYLKEYIGRYYPYQKFASQLLGYVKNDVNDFHGQYGLEKYYDKYLSNQKFSNNIIDFLSLDNLLYKRNNYDVIASIDFNIQKKSEDLLVDYVKKWEAEGGSVVVMDPRSGKVLALANYPNFDPNNYWEYDLSFFDNPVVQYVYEPGSVFKIITVAAGLDSKRITPKTEYYDNGEVVVNGKKIQNWDLKAHGLVNVYEIIANSLNTGAAFLEKLIGHDIFHQYVLKFGFDEKTGIDLPNEVSGNISNLKSFNDIYFATASFGQAISVTPIEMINAFAAIANNGKMMKPFVVEKIVNTEGEEKIINKPTVKKEVIQEETAQQLRIIMTYSVDKNQLAAIKGYQIAGKTGTAQVPLKGGGYSSTETIQSFIGYAPAENPQFVILAKLNKPKAPLAGQTVVPMFKELTQFILNYYEIAPTF